MQNKFNRLIELLQNKMNSKKSERNSIMKRKNIIASNVYVLETDIKTENEKLKELESSLKKYKLYYFKVMGIVLYMILASFAS